MKCRSIGSYGVTSIGLTVETFAPITTRAVVARWQIPSPGSGRSRVRFLSLLRYKAGSALPSWRTAAHLPLAWRDSLRRFGTAAGCQYRRRCELDHPAWLNAGGLAQPGSTGQRSRLGRSSCMSQLTFSFCPSVSIKAQFSSFTNRSMPNSLKTPLNESPQGTSALMTKCATSSS